MGHLIQLINADGTWTFEYDALGSRTAVTHNGQRTEYLVDPTGPGSVVGEYNGSGQLLAHYSYGLGSRTDSSSQRSYFDFDATGSTVGLSASNGAYANTYSYLPFGEILSRSESIRNPFQFDGAMGIQNDGSGLNFMRARYYDPSLGRFTQPDPIDIAGGLNLYTFALNDPMTAADPSGLLPISPLATTLSLINPLAVTMSGGISPLATTLAGGTSPLATTLTGQGISPMATTLSAESLGNTMLASVSDAAANPLAYEARAVNLFTARIGGSATEFGLSEAQFQAALQQAEAIIARRAAGAALARGGLYGILAAEIAVIGYSLGQLGMAYLTYGTPSNAAGQIPDCDPSLPAALNFITICDDTPISGPEDIVATADSTQVSSNDPNFISGAAGFGTANYIPNGVTLPYTIDFENQASASAPAAQVVVTQHLDDDLDLSTFQLGSFGFGRMNFDIPAGRQVYTTRIDDRANTGVFVDLNAELDVPTRTVTWTFTSIDPETLTLPADPLKGFLPPDTTAPEGEGYVTYTVAPKSGRATGTTIDAQASIVFDLNAPIATNLFTNTIDAGPPASVVAPLPATVNTPSFTVSWSGQDDTGGSGIASYDIFMSVDGGAYAPLLIATTATSTTINGMVGHSYSFYSVATDNIGLRELVPFTADASTTVVAANTAPVAADVAASAFEHGPAVQVTASYTDPDVGDSHSFAIDSTGTKGKVTDLGNGVFSYDPNGAFAESQGRRNRHRHVHLYGDRRLQCLLDRYGDGRDHWGERSATRG